MNHSVLSKILFLFAFTFTTMYFIMGQIDKSRFLEIAISLLLLFLIHLFIEKNNIWRNSFCILLWISESSKRSQFLYPKSFSRLIYLSYLVPILSKIFLEHSLWHPSITIIWGIFLTSKICLGMPFARAGREQIPSFFLPNLLNYFKCNKPC